MCSVLKCSEVCVMGINKSHIVNETGFKCVLWPGLVNGQNPIGAHVRLMQLNSTNCSYLTGCHSGSQLCSWTYDQACDSDIPSM